MTVERQAHTSPPDREPADQPPTPHDLRQAELSDLRNQNASLYGLYTAHTIHAPEYL